MQTDDFLRKYVDRHDIASRLATLLIKRGLLTSSAILRFRDEHNSNFKVIEQLGSVGQIYLTWAIQKFEAEQSGTESENEQFAAIAQIATMES